VVLHAVAGTLMPTLMVVMMTRFFGARRSWTEGLSIVPFALFGGLAFTVPYVLTGFLLGPEFPSLLGVEEAGTRARREVDEALAALEAAGLSSHELVGLARFMVERDR